MSDSAYKIVQLKNGERTVHSIEYGETYHPGIGPGAEADALYVQQLRLPQRIRDCREEFAIWDVGLGAAANALTAIRRIQDALGEAGSVRPNLRIVSFDKNTNAAAFALQHSRELAYVRGQETLLRELLNSGEVRCSDSWFDLVWRVEVGDFPAFVQWFAAAGHDAAVPPPHAVLFDPHSLKENPDMWTVDLFTKLFLALDRQRPCALANFTRSTMARVALLLGGFFVGKGHPSGFKEETTVAANRLELLDEPLDQRWLERAKRSGSAEPLREPVYRQAPLSPETFALLANHPQFAHCA